MKILGKTILHSSKKFDYALHRLETNSGEIIERPFIDHPGSVIMIPVLPDGRLVLIRQFRHPCNRVFLELPAGTAERGEPLEQCAVRELAEETGYRTARMERLQDMFPLPGACNELMAYYRCLDLSPGPVRREIDEEMDVEIHPLEDLLRFVDDGAISDGKSIIGIWREAKIRGLSL